MLNMDIPILKYVILDNIRLIALGINNQYSIYQRSSDIIHIKKAKNSCLN